ncbi:MAG TPA: hypothetical protein VM282_23860 [Acidimicrobiales bacterium]|nr:hypothetical protein [Acidimicrobiales bacterium]
MSDNEFRVLLDGVSGVPALADRREILRARIERRRVRHRRLVASVAAAATVGMLGMVAIELGGTQRNDVPISAYPIVSDRATTGGDAVVLRSLGGGQILVEVAGIDAMASTTDRPVAEYSVIDPPATSRFAVTGSTITKDEHDKPIIIVVVHVVGDGVHRVRVSLADGVSDETAPVGPVAVLVLRPAHDENTPRVSVDAIEPDGTTVSTLDVAPFAQRPWSCATNTEVFQAQRSAIAAESSAAREVSAPLVLIASPLRARCPGD